MRQGPTRTRPVFEDDGADLIEDRSVLARAARAIAASSLLLERLCAWGPVQPSPCHDKNVAAASTVASRPERRKVPG